MDACILIVFYEQNGQNMSVLFLPREENKMALLDKLNSISFRTEKIKAPEIGDGAELILRELTAGQHADFIDKLKDEEFRTSEKRLTAFMIMNCLVDENGNRENAQPASRRFISYVPQGNTLLSGSIAQNLRMGKKNASEEELWEALRMADADTFVMKTEDGLDTRLTEKAGGLSEGQAQRIAIARALIRNKPQLILDEATSALDEDTESRILSRITKSYGKTIFIITHRRSMLRYCNRVIELGDDATATIRDLK